MEARHEHLRQLTLEELAGSISEADLQELRSLLSDPEHQLIYENYKKELINAGAIEAMNKFDREVSATGIISAAEKNRRINRNKKLLFAAAAVAALAISTLLLRQDHNTSAITQKISTKNPDQVLFTLGQTSTMLLDRDTTQTIGTGSTAVRLVQQGNAVTIIPTSPGYSASTGSIIVPPAKQYNVTLPDGTIIRLNAATTLNFAINPAKNERKVFLEGEAYFEVHSSPSQPFIVTAGPVEIQVLGTTFNVNNYVDSVKVALVKGKVNLKASNTVTHLPIGHQATYNNGRFTHRAFDPSNTLSWMSNTTRIELASARELPSIIRRYFNTSVSLDKSLARNNAFIGNLNKTKPLSDFLDAMQFTGYINGYKISGDSCYLY